MNPPKMLELDKYIINKRKELDKLRAEHEKLLASTIPVSDTDSEIKVLNSELCKLQAEICVVEGSEPETGYSEWLEDERSKNELLQSLHHKLVRRLRRLSRLFPTYSTNSEKLKTSIRNKSGEVLTKSFYRVLKDFVFELQDRTFTSDDWHKINFVPIDHTFSKEHIKLLCSCGIIQRSKENDAVFHLKNS
ncbi:uncharacterized protein TNIN_18311 [Trichonephila inaurata madagascariensis]|uniref:Uncharacterized protein n=1 Tax=Trichonephila inaurata madagascariensis TaxID=2747483 RepID=A0A8X7BY28_9ARAC|nr:uncharacterized protein TNIN_18311 [Trichonephila inaurata madagascariensis]